MLDNYTKNYIKRVKKWIIDNSIEPEYKIYEILWALSLDQILWDDIPPDFCEKFNIPHTRDYGIDLISLDATKASQCKLYGPNSTISFKCISTFFSYAKGILNIGDINKMLLLTSNQAKIDSMVCRLNIPTIRKNTDELLLSLETKLSQVISEDNSENSQITIEERPFLLKCFNLFINNDKKDFNFQLPCGVGKSFIMYYIILKELIINKKSKYIIFVPRIQLAYQHKKYLDKLNITNQIIGDGNNKFLKTPSVTICIYPSANKIKNNEFKYKFIDEAHHLENQDSIYKSNIDMIPYEKSLSLSATFKNQEQLDYRMSLREAIEAGYISDYKILFEYFTSGNKDEALLNLCVKRREWFPAFIYFNRRERAIEFSNKLNEKGVKSNYILSDTSIKEQEEVQNKIINGELDIVCLVGCWNEGTSISNLKTVILGDMRYSSINRIQIIMRADRLHETKPYYNIVIPIQQNELNEENNNYDDISNFIKTLFDIDPKLKESLKNKEKSCRIKIGIDGEYIKELKEDDLEEEKDDIKADHIYTIVYDSLGNMIGGLTLDEKIKEFIEYVEKNGIPKEKSKEAKFSDNTIMSSWFHGTIKKQIINNNLYHSNVYKKLIINLKIKAELDRYINVVKDKDIFIKLLTNEKIKEFIEYVEKNGIPKNREKFSDSVLIKNWYNNQKDLNNK